MEYVKVMQRVLNPPEQDFVKIDGEGAGEPAVELSMAG